MFRKARHEASNFSLMCPGFEGTYIAVFVLNTRTNPQTEQLSALPSNCFWVLHILSFYVTQFDLQHYFSTYVL